jgi:hypothetical protein
LPSFTRRPLSCRSTTAGEEEDELDKTEETEENEEEGEDDDETPLCKPLETLGRNI